MDQYQQFIATSRYARWLPKEKRRETWEETVKRYIDFFYEDTPEVGEGTFDELYEAILNMEAMPSMRCLMTAGKAFGS